ncbi:FAD-binding-3 domain-containing protein [Mycena kentingensis (nom. inval.)]|nr:FAD-binding-3 domain-containing protein [Mycena kentingensis (nom. inval.)]
MTALNFIIVGGSVAGLAAAIALKDAGHNVVVLEKDVRLGGAGQGINGCARIPPNGTKILNDWGLAGAAAGQTSTIGGWSVYKYNRPEGSEEPDKLGVQRSWPELLQEARGEYMMFRHESFLQLLYDKLAPIPSPIPRIPVEFAGPETAKSNDNKGIATVHLNACVASIDCAASSVTLQSGEVLIGDAILGADGRNGVVRRALMREEGLEGGETSIGLAFCSALIPKERVFEHGLGEIFYDDVGMSLWLGHGRAALTCQAGGDHDLMLAIYTPDTQHELASIDSAWKQPPSVRLVDVIGVCDPIIHKLASLAGPASCVQIKTPPRLDSWVSRSGRVLAIGEAAHPPPTGGTHLHTAALEDGLFIGKIFSHTRDPARIPEFQKAFQEAREPRCTQIIQQDHETIAMLTLPDGDIQKMLDAALRANTAAGRNAMEGEDLHKIKEDFIIANGYDADDDADEWWINWGRLKDAADVVREKEPQYSDEEEMARTPRQHVRAPMGYQ